MDFSENLQLINRQTSWQKIFFIIFLIFTFIMAIAFLIFNPYDKMALVIPEEASAYAKIKTQEKFNDLQQQTINNFLAKHSGMEESFWFEIWQHNRQIGLYVVNGQIFGIIERNTRNFEILNKYSISFDDNNEKNLLNFPKINLKLNNSWLKQSSIKINKDFEIYIKSGLFIKNFLNYQNTKNFNQFIYLYGKIRTSGAMEIFVTGKGIGQKNSAYTNIFINNLPNDFLTYENNINFTDFDEIEFTETNLYLNLLKNLPHHASYQTSADFLIETKDITLNDLQETIINIMAKTFPSIKNKILPDGTESRSYWKQINDWRFLEENNLYTLYKNEQPFNLQIRQNNESWQIVFQQKENKETQILTSFQKNCLETKKSVFLKSFKNNLFSLLTIININEDNLKICID